MKKIFQIITAMMMATSAVTYAASSATKQDLGSMIITNDIATDYIVIHDQLMTKDAKGNTIYCPSYDWFDIKKKTCLDSQGFNKWRYFRNAVPAGKIYVGFEVRHNFLIVYWK